MSSYSPQDLEDKIKANLTDVTFIVSTYLHINSPTSIIQLHLYIVHKKDTRDYKVQVLIYLYYLINHMEKYFNCLTSYTYNFSHVVTTTESTISTALISYSLSCDLISH